MSSPLLAFFPSSIAARAIVDRDGLARAARAWSEADVAVVVGSGIGGLVLAASLAEKMRVVLVTGKPPVPKRLVAGCSLRRATLRTIADAFGLGLDVLIDRLGRRGAFDALGTGRIGSDLTEVVHIHREREIVGLSTRHGAILAALRGALPDVPKLDVIAGDIRPDLRVVLADGEAELPLARGRHVVIDATPQGVLGASAKIEAKRSVLACQVPLASMRAPSCGTSVGYAPQLVGAPAHLAFFTPFSDPDTADADWYGINTLVVDDDLLASGGRESLAADLRARLERSARALGFSVVDPDATFGAAIMPVRRPSIDHARASIDRARHVVATHPTFSPGAVAINVDGMLAESIGATALARRMIGTGNVLDRARAGLMDAYDALAPVRDANRALERAFFELPPTLVYGIQRALPRSGWRALVARWAELGRNELARTRL